ncbi:cell surface protein [Listeria ivanovii]|uniref:LPXTG cell wall anchor domain-containing protein n=1 Tax=Listeria ivanovii TaxID=1638 RepID=UPI000DA9E623|nr:LPXTG cell wall anchor domain-containing protein [Listeria ivanovii]PZF88064.1 cell surface protein [Listeria ivanovii]PZF93285.1 cell surface protein [Listeria ivanovii]PZG04112.1 cell surface protein [Listeria ivanovii]PZG08541.1 cell surface protein [Listeria ivanovii]PZG25386.1 cell surface protein [Listeria ivanovii]
MKKIIFISFCSLLLLGLPLITNAYSDTATSHVGVTFKQDPGTKSGDTDDKSGTFPSKKPLTRLPKTGDTSELYLIAIGLGLLIIAKKSYFKEVI